MNPREKQPSTPRQTSNSSTQTPSQTYQRRYSDIEWASPFYPVTPDSLVLRHDTASISPHSSTASSSTISNNLSPQSRHISLSLPTRREPTDHRRSSLPIHFIHPSNRRNSNSSSQSPSLSGSFPPRSPFTLDSPFTPISNPSNDPSAILPSLFSSRSKPLPKLGGNRNCAGCGVEVTYFESVPGPLETRFHRKCLVCRVCGKQMGVGSRVETWEEVDEDTEGPQNSISDPSGVVDAHYPITGGGGERGRKVIKNMRFLCRGCELEGRG
ncbi:hypothetical protein BZA77DRAFT_356210 [Pyronema omphalodes]|nr:hypothetical protein BZA77DRAFT_356210 [Pyronema omphalodes]